MSTLAAEMFYPADQYVKEEVLDDEGLPALDENGKPVTKQVLRDGAKGYMIKPLTSLQLTEVMSLGTANTARFSFSFPVILKLLRFGLDGEDASKKIESMPSSHHAMVAYDIYQKSQLLDEERKNS